MTKLIPKSQLASQRGQVLDSSQAAYNLRQALSSPDNLQGFDDLLRAVGVHRSNYMQATHQKKLIDAVSSGDWLMVVPRVAADNGGASWNAFKPKPEPPPAQHLVEDHAFTLPQPVESGFHIIQRPMSLETLERSLYENSPSDALRKVFRSLNRHLGEQVKPGQMVIFSDSRHYLCRREEAQMMIAAEKTNEALKDLSDEEAAFMVEHHEVIEPFLGVASGALGVASFMVGQHLETLRNTLTELERLHQEQYRQYGHLKSPVFFAQRKRLMAKLDASLGPMMRKTTGIPDHPKLKRALGLSTRRTVHHWSKAGAPTQLPGYATHIEGVARASKYMKAGGYVAIGLGASSAAMKIHETCRAGRVEECRQVKFVEGGRLLGNVAGGAVASAIGVTVAEGTCLAIGAGTYGVGGMVCMLVVSGMLASQMGDSGGQAGEYFGEKLYEVTE
ncbi:hypothetical protein C1Y08_21870 [Pseudomonas sp. FW306-02-F02-AA]|uniref:SSU ribosomal protein S2p (SAe) n=1 Tax=Pseudomonas fluorescens TaxID=294 RepID=A0A0N9VUP8_PSEFL|nr:MULTISPECIES: hypothetical protein [Pseudomonas]ALI02107.1 hypothetical protein AO353_13805 [Pseudomonas fluorescens]PMZ01060.1 hypothetical protein C1Y07_27340 [Pseudomonas sp. FW306-02-F02-AB]PMZ06436.1 hypothetical protein C1Y06_29795 [Pseudomonas sp. FW306-02-H06C]PMZ13807.1 hypothetical protein C1Y08_21870 [Pseudomonas sp. FW306-02-F02-AA]PMZ19198.1 hypothetical protein C1Y09_25470 [Pseudomonas sp. FW306-02-F08-AA]